MFRDVRFLLGGHGRGFDFLRFRLLPRRGDHGGEFLHRGDFRRRRQRRHILLRIKSLGFDLLDQRRALFFGAVPLPGENARHGGGFRVWQGEGRVGSRPSRGHQLFIAQRVEHAVLGIHAPDHDSAKILRRTKFPEPVSANHHAGDVGGVLLPQAGLAVMHQRQPFPVRKEPDGGEGQRHFLEPVRLVLAHQEGARRHAWQAAFQQFVFGVQVLERVGLVAFQRFRQPLVRLRGVEEAPVDVAGETGEILFQPGSVIRAA